MKTAKLYDKDFYAWTQEQIKLLKQKGSTSFVGKL